MPRSIARWTAVSFALIVAAASCSSNDDDTASLDPSAGRQQTSVASPGPSPTPAVSPAGASTPAVDREPLTITTSSRVSVDLFAELAVTPEERAQGLMGRTALEPDSGMLFVIQPPGRGFWMKDTPIALTIAFIAACGEIVDLIDMEPLSEEVKNASEPYAFALEMELGWFSENGIAVGDIVELPPELLPAAEC
jgi:uncharacterized membrane protein (UPF0127 family)